MAETYPPHIDPEIAQLGREEFSKADHAQLREYIRALQRSPMDMSQTAMNIQGNHLEPVEGVEPPFIGPFTITEYIDDKADIAALEASEMMLEDAFTSWQAGAFRALKQ